MSKNGKVIDFTSAGFRIDGRVYDSGAVPLAVTRIIEALEKLPFKDLLTTRQLAGLVGLQHSSLSHYTSHSALLSHKYDSGKASRGNYWGSTRTVLELKRMLEKS